MESFDTLIIGADAAGLSAAVQIRSEKKDQRIGILEKGEIISYGACGLPYAIEGKIDSFDALIHFTSQSFGEKYNINFFTSTEATAIDFQSRVVTASRGEESLQFRYGNLLIATGATPTRVPGLDYSSPRIFSLKSIPDGQAIQKAIQDLKPQKALIVGAGYIGLEMADVLVELGLKVEVIEMADRPVPRMNEMIGKAVLDRMAKKGITFHGGVGVESSMDQGDRVVLKTGAGEMEADLVITGTGVRPATRFLEGSELEMDRGAIVVDRFGQTNLEGVFAAGDCAMVYHKLLERNVYMPLGSTANKQGRIAGQNMAGVQIALPGILGTQIFKFFDLALASTGLGIDEAKSIGIEAIAIDGSRPGKAGYYPGAGKMGVQLTVEKSTGRILGGTIVGPLHTAAYIDVIGAMAQGGILASEAAYFDGAYAPPFAPVWNAVISAAGKYGR